MLRFRIGYLLVHLAISATTSAQNFTNQQGFVLAGGISQPGRFQAFLGTQPEPGIRQFQAFSWEAGFLQIHRITPSVSISRGISVIMLGNSLRKDEEFWVTEDNDSIHFAGNRQRQENYFLSFPFRWSFYLNRHPAGRWFAGPGIALSLPLFEIQFVKGSDREGFYHEISEKRFPRKGPYAFICPELEAGFQQEFPDCSLLRFSIFSNVRAIGLFKGEEHYYLQHFSGMRIAWFWGNN